MGCFGSKNASSSNPSGNNQNQNEVKNNAATQQQQNNNNNSPTKVNNEGNSNGAEPNFNQNDANIIPGQTQQTPAAVTTVPTPPPVTAAAATPASTAETTQATSIPGQPGTEPSKATPAALPEAAVPSPDDPDDEGIPPDDVTEDSVYLAEYHVADHALGTKLTEDDLEFKKILLNLNTLNINSASSGGILDPSSTSPSQPASPKSKAVSAAASTAADSGPSDGWCTCVLLRGSYKNIYGQILEQVTKNHASGCGHLVNGVPLISDMSKMKGDFKIYPLHSDSLRYVLKNQGGVPNSSSSSLGTHCPRPIKVPISEFSSRIRPRLTPYSHSVGKVARRILEMLETSHSAEDKKKVFQKLSDFELPWQIPNQVVKETCEVYLDDDSWTSVRKRWKKALTRVIESLGSNSFEDQAPINLLSNLS